METFTTTVRGEGCKHYPMVIFPTAMEIPTSWARVALNKTLLAFLYVRGTGRNRRMALPAWLAPFAIGDTVDVRIEPAEPFRARGASTDRFDWNAFVENDERTFATDEPGGVLRLWSRYSAPFDLLRCPPAEALYWSLGFYQAEGSKSATGGDFSFANTNPLLIENAIKQLALLGIAPTQLYAEILQGADESREAVMTKYAQLGIEIRAVRPRSGKGSHSYVLHARNSKPFRGLVCRALAHIFATEFPSREAAKAFAFGWLDGDGSITLTDTDTKLRLAGLPEEHEVVKRALTQVFGWDLSMASTRYKGNKEGSRIGLKAERLIDLLDANAFPFSMNYVRLLLGLDRRSQGDHVQAARRRYTEETEKARQLWATEPHRFGVKCASLPSQFKLRIR